MSAAAPDGSGAGGDRPRGFQKFLRRASTVLRRDRSKRKSEIPPEALVPVRDEGAPASSAAASAPVTGPSTEPAKPTAEQAPVVPPPEAKVEDTVPEPEKPKGPTAAEGHEVQKEKARAMFAKYNMTLEEGEWTPVFKGDAIRVEKKVRMRIKRHCHRCQTSFGVEKLCNTCGHNRCKKCPKTPISSRKDAKGKISITSGSIVVDDAYMTFLNLDPLTMPYRRSTKELISPPSYKRICHKCQTLFAGNAPQCGKCGHSRCAQCPRDPPMAPSLPDPGYPRRRQMRSLRLRIRYTCHECQRTFRDLERACMKCGHEKCDKCKSDPALDSSGQTPDTDALRQVEERLRSMDVSSQATAA